MGAIELTGISFHYDAVPVLEGMDLHIARGERFALLGPNGAGKTTTIRLLLGLLRPSAGSVSVLGLDPTTAGAEVRSRSGALLESAGSYEALSVIENLRFHADLFGMTEARFRSRASELIQTLGLAGLEDRGASHLSLGQKRRLTLARALLHEPELLILDEPTNGLDPIAARELYRLLIRMTDQDGSTLLVTTHNLAEVESVCHRAAIIHHGSLVACDTIGALTDELSRPTLDLICDAVPDGYETALASVSGVASVTRTELGLNIELTSDGPINAILAHAMDAGVGLLEVRRHRASLTEVYLDRIASDAAAARGSPT